MAQNQGVLSMVLHGVSEGTPLGALNTPGTRDQDMHHVNSIVSATHDNTSPNNNGRRKYFTRQLFPPNYGPASGTKHENRAWNRANKYQREKDGAPFAGHCCKKRRREHWLALVNFCLPSQIDVIPAAHAPNDNER